MTVPIIFALPAISAIAGVGKAHARLIGKQHGVRHMTMVSVTSPPETSRTYEIMKAISTRESGGAGGGTSWETLMRLDAAWEATRSTKGGDAGPAPQFVKEMTTESIAEGGPQYDVVVCGGTIGIVFACALQLRGYRVAVVERSPELRGREQDWNISMKELRELVAAGLLMEEELDAAVGIVFNPMRCVFKGGRSVLVNDVLNVGVSPDMLIQSFRRRFEKAGGAVFEDTALQGMKVGADGVVAMLSTSGVENTLTARVCLDAMGNASPILRQRRHGTKPDGVCLVVGTMASGFDPETNVAGDIIATTTSIETGGTDGRSSHQLFWEAFPASSGPSDRTTYMFTYLDAEEDRPSLLEFLERYWEAMPQYQGVQLEDLEVQRVLYGWFPAYKNSPTPPPFDRVLPCGALPAPT